MRIKRDNMGRVVSYFDIYCRWEKAYDEDGNLVYFTNNKDMEWKAVYKDGELRYMVINEGYGLIFSPRRIMKLEFENDEVVSYRERGMTECYDTEGNVCSRSFNGVTEYFDKEGKVIASCTYSSRDESIEMYKGCDEPVGPYTAIDDSEKHCSSCGAKGHLSSECHAYDDMMEEASLAATNFRSKYGHRRHA